jgi:ABC-type nickel/cobalt efflux system permease component RcnA
LLLKLGPISALADAAASATFSGSDHIGIRTSLAFHAAAGLVVLLAAAVLAIYKPAGLVRNEPSAAADRALPTWVKICGGIIVLLILMVGVMIIFGGHGPSAHAS